MKRVLSKHIQVMLSMQQQQQLHNTILHCYIYTGTNDVISKVYPRVYKMV